MRYRGNIILAAHRGDRKTCPENTMPAFRRAIAFGVDMIETDVRMTCDGELVIMHDRNPKRTTGWDGIINEMTLEEVKRLDAGAWFSDEFRHTRVPTVAEFIALIKKTNVQINWELKDYPKDVGEVLAFAAVDKLIALIEENGLTDRSMVNSFSDQVLEYIHLKHGRKFPIHGQGIGNCRKAIDRASVSPTALYDWCCLYPDTPGMQPLDFPANFEYCAANGILSCVCVPDTLQTYRAYVELGCRMFTSNDIYEADRILKELGVRGEL